MLSIGAIAPTTQPAASIDQIITQLSSDDYHVRQAAADQLVDRGDAVRPQLATLAADPSDAERRNLAAGILARLDRIARQGPTFITLHQQNAPAQSVLDDLAKQAKVAIHFSPNALRANRLAPVTIDVDHKPFWIAVAEVSRLTRTHVQFGDASAGIELGTGRSSESPDGPLCQAGPFVITLVSASRERQLRYGDPHGVVSNDSLSLVLFVDPQSHPLEPPTATVDEAVDKSGRSILPADHSRLTSLNMRGKWTRSFSVELALDPEASVMKRLHGTIDATYAIESKTITVPDIQWNSHQFVSDGEASVKIDAATVGGRGGTYAISVKRKTPGLLDLSGLRLVDADNAILFDAKGSAMISGAGVIVLNGTFNKPTDIRRPVKLVWDVATRTETVHEPFVFTNLPLP